MLRQSSQASSRTSPTLGNTKAEATTEMAKPGGGHPAIARATVISVPKLRESRTQQAVNHRLFGGWNWLAAAA